jgi:hypothetical protein
MIELKEQLLVSLINTVSGISSNSKQNEFVKMVKIIPRKLRLLK